MNKKRLSSIGLFLSIVLLVGVFLAVPHSTQAASNTPIAVTQPSNCTPLAPDANGTRPDEETWLVAVSIKYDVSSGVHFSVSSSTKSCYYTCVTSSHAYGVAYAMAEGNSIIYASGPVHVLLIMPYTSVHGSETIMYAFTGPTNKVSVQIAPPSMSS